MLLLSAILGCLVCSLASFGVGALALRGLAGPGLRKHLELGPVALAASSLLLGQGLLAGLWMVIGLAGWFTAPVVLSILAALALLGLWPLSAEAAAVFQRVKAWLRNEWADSWPWRLLYLATALLVVFYAIAALVVSIPSHGDGAAFYLPFGKWLIAKGALRPFPAYEHFSQLPILGELHFTVMMFFGVEQEARLIVTPTTLAGAALLVALGARSGLGRRAQWMLVAMAWTSSTFAERLTDGKTDLFGFALGMAAYYWAAIYRRREDAAALRLSGLFVCLAALAKLSLVTSVFPGIVLLVSWTTLGQNRGSSLWQKARALTSAWFHLGCLALLLATIHCLKNGVVYGEPFAPFFLLSASKTWLYQASYHSPGVAWEIFLKYPLILVFGSVYGQGGNLSLLFLAFAPLFILLPRPRSVWDSEMLKIGIVASSGLVCYLIASHVTSNAQVAPRYILPTLLLFSVPLARAAELVTEKESRPRGLTPVIWLALFSALFFTHQGGDLRRWPRHLWIHLSQGENPGKDSALTALYELNRRAAPGDRLYMCGATRLCLRTDLLQCLNNMNDPIVGERPQDRWAALHARGFTWLFIDLRLRPELASQLGLDEEKGPLDVPAWLTVERVFANQSCLLCRLVPGSEAPPADVVTKEIRPGVWEVLNR